MCNIFKNNLVSIKTDLIILENMFGVKKLRSTKQKPP